MYCLHVRLFPRIAAGARGIQGPGVVNIRIIKCLYTLLRSYIQGLLDTVAVRLGTELNSRSRASKALWRSRRSIGGLQCASGPATQPGQPGSTPFMSFGACYNAMRICSVCQTRPSLLKSSRPPSRDSNPNDSGLNPR